MTYEQMLTLSLFFWAFVFGLFYREPPQKIWISIKPTKAPPPEAFEKDYD
tara:strand:- start:148 stop:297 length:150 start_codon:yes stop_codon:yes gene_type:complete